MNSYVNSFLEWQKLLDIHESDFDFKNLIKSLVKWLKTNKNQKNKLKKLFSLRFNSMNSLMIFSKNPNNKNEWYNSWKNPSEVIKEN